MRPPSRLASLLGLLGAAALVLPAAAQARRTVPQGWLGVSITGQALANPSLLPRETQLMGANGVEALRFPVYWSAAQPYKSPSSVPESQRGNFYVSYGHPTDLRGTDQIVLNAARHGFRTLPTVLASPAWASAGNHGQIAGPRHTSDYTHFLGTLVKRYGRNGTLWAQNPTVPERPILRWQVWNEPDHPNFWQRPWEKGYVSLLRAAHKTLKTLDRRNVVELGSLTGYSWVDLKKLYKAGMHRSDFDVLTIHPYTAKPSNVIQTLVNDRKVLRTYKDTGKPIDVTELSWPASRGRVPKSKQVSFATTESDQRARMASAIALLAKNRTKLKITGVYWYTWDSSYSGTNPWNYSGLRQLNSDGTGTSKLSLGTFRRAAFKLEGR